MNPFAAVSWYWRAWRARSITFAVLFALSLVGISVLSWLRYVLREVGAPWYLWLVAPFAAVAVLARKEADWMPDPAERRKWALRIVVGAIIVTVVIAKVTPRQETEFSTTPPVHSGGRADPHGR
ncbi:MAG: hypothetical protein ABIZ81_14040 [Opitutaceae bacterium]